MLITMHNNKYVFCSIADNLVPVLTHNYFNQLIVNLRYFLTLDKVFKSAFQEIIHELLNISNRHCRQITPISIVACVVAADWVRLHDAEEGEIGWLDGDEVAECLHGGFVLFAGGGEEDFAFEGGGGLGENLLVGGFSVC